MTREMATQGKVPHDKAADPQPLPLLTGSWDENQSWEFYQATKAPDFALCTAVFCLAILPDTKQVVLTKNHRGWEMLGGHIESGETLEQTLLRECLEEGGYTPEHLQLFGYRRIIAKRPMPHNQKRDGFYPFPHSYIPHFIATSTHSLQKPSGAEIIESRAFSFEEIGALALNMRQWPILKVMLDFYDD